MIAEERWTPGGTYARCRIPPCIQEKKLYEKLLKMKALSLSSLSACQSWEGRDRMSGLLISLAIEELQ